MRTSLTASGTQPTTAAETRPGRWRVWLRAIRIPSFTAAIVPILVGSALALVDGRFDPILTAAMLVAAIACQAGANLANDYFDQLKGIDTAESLGPSKVIQQGLLSPAAVRRGMAVAFGLATVIGLGIVAASGWPVLVLALVSLGAAYFYTGGPRPLGYVALGELTVFLTMGLGMVAGAYYVLTGRLTLPSILVAIPVACLVAAILHANNVRDRDLDRRAGKWTLATLLGRRAATVEYALLVAGAYAGTVAVVVAAPRLWSVLIAFATVPTGYRLVRLVGQTDDPTLLNVALRRTAGLHLQFGLLLTAGLLIGAALGR